MLDDLKDPGVPDRMRINLNLDHKASYATQARGVTRERMVYAAKAAAVLAADVRCHPGE